VQRSHYRILRVHREDSEQRAQVRDAGGIVTQTVRTELQHCCAPLLLASLDNYRAISARWEELGVEFATGTTSVEGGFFAARQKMFTPQQRKVSEKYFKKAGRAAMLSLNHHLLHRHHLPVIARKDANILRMLERMRLWLLHRALHDSKLVASAETQFRQYLEDVVADR
jgi:hypothetical protein